MPETSNERQARYNLMLAQALGLVRQEDNRITGFAEVKFTYREKQTGFGQKPRCWGQPGRRRKTTC